jgi:hypothetical protein
MSDEKFYNYTHIVGPFTSGGILSENKANIERGEKKTEKERRERGRGREGRRGKEGGTGGVKSNYSKAWGDTESELDVQLLGTVGSGAENWFWTITDGWIYEVSLVSRTLFPVSFSINKLNRWLCRFTTTLPSLGSSLLATDGPRYASLGGRRGRGEGKGERGKEKGERRKEKGERRKEKGESRKEKGERSKRGKKQKRKGEAQKVEGN